MSFRGLLQDSKSLAIYSNHFKQSNYNNMHDPDIKRRNLVRNAVPSIRIPDPDPSNASKRAKRMERKARSEIVRQMLKQSEKETAEYRKIPHCLEEILNQSSVSGDTGNLTLSENSIQDPVSACRNDDSTESGVSEPFKVTTFNPKQSSLLHEDVDDDHDPDFNMRLVCDAISVSAPNAVQTGNTSDVDQSASNMTPNPVFDQIFESMEHPSKLPLSITVGWAPIISLSFSFLHDGFSYCRASSCKRLILYGFIYPLPIIRQVNADEAIHHIIAEKTEICINLSTRFTKSPLNKLLGCTL